MANYPGLETRNGVYRVRWRIPIEVKQAVESNLSEWKKVLLVKGDLYNKWKPVIAKNELLRDVVTKSLKTKNRRDATKRHHVAALEFNSLYSSIIAAMNRQKVIPTEWDARRIVQNYFHEQDAADALSFRDIAPRSEFDETERSIAEDIAHAGNDHPHAEHEYIRLAGDLLKKEGLDEKPTTEGSRWLTHFLRRADIALGERNLERLKKNFDLPIFDQLFIVPTASGAPNNSIEEGKTFDQAFDEYLEEKSSEVRSAKTIPGYKFVRHIFDSVIDANKPVASVNRQDCKAVRDVLKTLPSNSSKKKETRDLSIREAARVGEKLGLEPLAISTANGYLADLSSFFNWALAEDYVKKNPASGLKVGKDFVPQHRKRRSFTADELNRIFNAPIFSGCIDDQRGYAKPGKNKPRNARFWIPLLSLWTGLRLGEICQLRVQDIEMKDGVFCIATIWDDEDSGGGHVTEEKVIRSLKTEASARLIPIHSTLIDIGFVAFVELARNEGRERLFPELKADSTGYLSGNFSKWFARFLETVGVKRSRNCFHSFRHTYRDALRKAQVSRDTVIAVGGWAEIMTSDNYGDGLPPSKVKIELENIRFEGVTFSHLQIG